MTRHRVLLQDLMLALAWAVSPGIAQENRVTVLSIGGDDTIRVSDGGKRITVRLACIDAPEIAQAPHGEQARRYLQSWLRIGSNVRLIPKTIDRYCHTVAEVIGAVNLNLAMVEEGQAFAYRKYLGQCNAQQYLDAEARASRRRIGVWQVSGGITMPWEFRRMRASTRPVVLPDPFRAATGISMATVMERRVKVFAAEMMNNGTIGDSRLSHSARVCSLLPHIDGTHRP